MAQARRRAQRRAHHYIYRTTCEVTGRYYIGMHSTDDLDDGYVGSGKRLRYSINKHGLDKHRTEIVEFCEDREALRLREAELVNEEALRDEQCMNLKLGGEGGWDHIKGGSFSGKSHSDSYKRNMSELSKERWKSEDYRSNMIAHFSERAKSRIGNKSTFFGKHHTDETKAKIGAITSKAQKGHGNSQYDTCWITDGVKNKKIKIEQLSEMDDGWRRGRKMKSRKELTGV